MRINTESLRRMNRVFDQIRSSGHPIYESVFLDLEKEVAFFQSPAPAWVRVSVDLEGELPKGAPMRFCVDGQKFFSLVNTFDTLEIEGKAFISDTGNRFEIESYSEEVNTPDMDSLDEYECSTIQSDPDFLGHLKNAQSFLSSDMNSPFSCIFLAGDKMVALQETKYYEALMPFNMDAVLPQNTVKILLGLAPVGEVDFCVRKMEDASIIQIRTEGFDYRYSSSTNYVLPIDIESESFRSSFEHDNFFVVEKEEIIHNLRFLENFVREVANTRARLYFKPFEKKISFEITDNAHVVHSVPVHMFWGDIEEDENFQVSISDLRSSIQKIGSSKVALRYDRDKAPIKFEEFEGDDSYFMIQVRLEED